LELRLTNRTQPISKKSLGDGHQELAGKQDNPGIRKTVIYRNENHPDSRETDKFADRPIRE
jgi:hypothetical protein